MAIAIAYTSFVSCGKAGVVAANQCENAGDKLTAAATAWSSDPTNKTKCNAYVASIKELLKDCPNFYTGAAKQAIVDFQNTACK